jgi:hypothetical protein
MASPPVRRCPTDRAGSRAADLAGAARGGKPTRRRAR